MATKKGTKYECEECGVVVVVEDACGCTTCDLICCDAPMKEVKTKSPAKAPAKVAKVKAK
jgi:hypothetical protein